MTRYARRYIAASSLAPLFVLLTQVAVSADEPPITLVGMHGHIDGIVLPGPELEVRPLEDPQAPFVLRIARVSPHGTAFRYDFVYYALEPRTYDLTQYLRPKNGAAGVKLPPLQVQVKGLLGPGLIHPHALHPREASWFARYRLVLIVAASLWTAGLLVILFWGRRKKRVAPSDAGRPESVADRLRPLVVRAMAGMLSANQMAELERMLLAFWRQRLGLEHEKAAAAVAKMRVHPEAGVLLNQLELWLHRPGTAAQVDVGKLLWPYREIAADKPGDVPAGNGVMA